MRQTKVTTITRSVLLTVCLVTTFGVWAPRSAFACDCSSHGDPCYAINQRYVRDPPEHRSVNKAANVFSGRVLNIDVRATASPFGPRVYYRFAVIEVFSGRTPRTIELSAGASNCQFPFRVGEEYLVYAHPSAAGLTTSICTRTARLSERRHEVELLRELKSGVPRTRLWGSVSRMERVVDGSPQHLRNTIALPGIRVTARRGEFARATTTDEHGAFFFRGLPPGRYSVTADFKDPYDERNDRYEVNLHCLVEYRIQATRIPIVGTATRADGTLIARRVAAVSVDGGLDAPLESRSTVALLDRAGQWKFEGLPPGRYIIGLGVFDRMPWDPAQRPVWYPNAQAAREAEVIEVTRDGQRIIDLKSPPPPDEIQIRGVITGAQGGSIALYDVEQGRSVSNASADAKGRFVVRGWKGRRYQLVASECQRSRLRSDPTDVPDDPAAEIQLVLSKPCVPRW